MFCLDYFPLKKYDDTIEQLKIKYNPNDSTLNSFLESRPNQTIIIDINGGFEEKDAKLFRSFAEKFTNFRVIFNYYDKEKLQLVKDWQIPFFFSNHVSTIDEVVGLMQYNPTDMYICEELGFRLAEVSTLLHDNHIKVRVYPNICQSSFAETPSLKTFFIRPEDIKVYSAFVDVFELIATEDTQDIIYSVYKRGKWFGKIKEIIPSFKHDLDSKFLIVNFGEFRCNCKKRCMYNPHSCTICDRCVDLSETLEEHQLFVKNH